MKGFTKGKGKGKVFIPTSNRKGRTEIKQLPLTKNKLRNNVSKVAPDNSDLIRKKSLIDMSEAEVKEAFGGEIPPSLYHQLYFSPHNKCHLCGKEGDAVATGAEHLPTCLSCSVKNPKGSIPTYEDKTGHNNERSDTQVRGKMTIDEEIKQATHDEKELDEFRKTTNESGKDTAVWLFFDWWDAYISGELHDDVTKEKVKILRKRIGSPESVDDVRLLRADDNEPTSADSKRHLIKKFLVEYDKHPIDATSTDLNTLMKTRLKIPILTTTGIPDELLPKGYEQVRE